MRRRRQLVSGLTIEDTNRINLIRLDTSTVIVFHRRISTCTYSCKSLLNSTLLQILLLTHLLNAYYFYMLLS